MLQSSKRQVTSCRYFWTLLLDFKAQSNLGIRNVSELRTITIVQIRLCVHKTIKGFLEDFFLLSASFVKWCTECHESNLIETLENSFILPSKPDITTQNLSCSLYKYIVSGWMFRILRRNVHHHSKETYVAYIIMCALNNSMHSAQKLSGTNAPK